MVQSAICPRTRVSIAIAHAIRTGRAAGLAQTSVLVARMGYLPSTGTVRRRRVVQARARRVTITVRVRRVQLESTSILRPIASLASTGHIQLGKRARRAIARACSAADP